MGFYTFLVWWAALYLNHHYFVDLIGALVFVVFFYAIGILILEIIIKQTKPSWANRKRRSKKSRRSDESITELEQLMDDESEEEKKGIV